MPDFWTHLIAGEKIAAGIKLKDIKSLLDQNYQLYNYALQGADFFFYNNFLPWQKAERGSKKGEQIFSSIIIFCPGSELKQGLQEGKNFIH
jgi:hypothetical protein